MVREAFGQGTIGRGGVFLCFFLLVGGRGLHYDRSRPVRGQDYRR